MVRNLMLILRLLLDRSESGAGLGISEDLQDFSNYTRYFAYDLGNQANRKKLACVARFSQRAKQGRSAPEHLQDFTNYTRTLRMIWEVRQSGVELPLCSSFRTNQPINIILIGWVKLQKNK